MKEITVPASLDQLENVQMFFDELLEENDCPMKTQFQIDVAVEEIFVNIANYAYPDSDGEATMKAEILDDPKRIVMTFIDKGFEFNPLAKEDVDTTLSASEREIGGLGIHMVKKSMDEVDYKFEDGCNIFTMTKNL